MSTDGTDLFMNARHEQKSDRLFVLANEAWDAGNPTKALELFKKAAADGNAFACTSIGYFFDSGIAVPKSKIRALYWYKKALHHGDTSCAPNNIGTVYRDIRNFKEARFWFLKALKNKDFDAAFELAKLHIKRGDRKLAIKYLQLASRRSKFCTLATNEDAKALLRKLMKR